jgi:hypothetical protein
MEIQRDFKELLESLNARRVEYLIVGGYALAHLGAPRATGDLDIYLHCTLENARRVIEALIAFGFNPAGLGPEDFSTPGTIVRMGVPPVRVDLITDIDGVNWEEAEKGKTAGNYGGVPVHYIGKREFIANKKASGRHKDLGDIEALGEL